MNTEIPSADEVSERLRPLRMGELRTLAHQSGVPFRTLINIRLGVTENPGLETVRKFFHLLPPTDTESQASTDRVA